MLFCKHLLHFFFFPPQTSLAVFKGIFPSEYLMLAHLKQGQQVAVPLSFQWGKKKERGFLFEDLYSPKQGTRQLSALGWTGTYGWCFLPSASCPCVISCAYIWLALPSLARWLQSLYNPFWRECGGLQKGALLSHAVLLFTGSNWIYSYWAEVFLLYFILVLMPSDQDNRGGHGPLI